MYVCVCVGNVIMSNLFMIVFSSYGHACEEDRMDDAMRQCSRCFKWYHEQCVGFSVEDTDDFQCPDRCE